LIPNPTNEAFDIPKDIFGNKEEEKDGAPQIKINEDMIMPQFSYNSQTLDRIYSFDYA
jgi:hypothetical protein